MQQSVVPMKVTKYKCRWKAENSKETIISSWCSP